MSTQSNGVAQDSGPIRRHHSGTQAYSHVHRERSRSPRPEAVSEHLTSHPVVRLQLWHSHRTSFQRALPVHTFALIDDPLESACEVVKTSVLDIFDSRPTSLLESFAPRTSIAPRADNTGEEADRTFTGIYRHILYGGILSLPCWCFTCRYTDWRPAVDGKDKEKDRTQTHTHTLRHPAALSQRMHDWCDEPSFAHAVFSSGSDATQ